MSPQRDVTITRQAPEQHMVDEDNQWTLESPTRTLKMGSLSALIATSTDTWQKNADKRKKNTKPGNVSNVRKKNTSPRTAKKHS